MITQPSRASWWLASHLTRTFQGHATHEGRASCLAEPQRLMGCLYTPRRLLSFHHGASWRTVSSGYVRFFPITRSSSFSSRLHNGVPGLWKTYLGLCYRGEHDGSPPPLRKPRGQPHVHHDPPAFCARVCGRAALDPGQIPTLCRALTTAKTLAILLSDGYSGLQFCLLGQV